MGQSICLKFLVEQMMLEESHLANSKLPLVLSHQVLAEKPQCKY